MPLESLLASHWTPYQVCVRRGWELTAAAIYPVPLRERLPIIKIPLRETDADVLLDLQALLDECYRKGHYGDDLDYRTEPEPPLEAADAAWAAELLRGQGRR